MIDATNSAFEQMDEDLSILQQSLQTAFVGFQEAKRAFEDGTDEVRRLLLFECSLIYECNICRNLFRSLANFISHKRAYCCGKVGVNGNHKGFTDHNSAVILQTSESDAANKRSRSTGSSPAPDSSRHSSVKGSTRNICRVIERLKREKAESNGESKHEDTVLHLERVPTSTQAVYQTVKRLQEDSIKTEIDEVHSLLTNVKTVVGPDGKAFTKHSYTAGDNDAINSSSENLGELFCKICNLGFQTNKTLQMHLEKKHNDLTYVYQCPACSQTFMKSAHVIRHLANDHKKSPRRIRMMREGIMKKRMRKCDVPVKGQNRELKRLQMSNDGAKSASQSNAVESSSKWKVMSSCIYCEVKFERRAALSAHLLKCMAKREATGSRQCLSSAPPAAKPKLELNNFYCNDVAEFTAAAIEQPFLGNSFKQEPVDANELNEMFANLQTVNNGIGLQTISLERLELSDSNDSIESCATHNTSVQSTSFRSIKSEPLFDSTDNNLEEQKISEELGNENEEGEEEDENEQQDCLNESNGEVEKASTKKTKKSKIKRLPQSEKLTTCRCKICNKQFNAVSNLRRHISMYHYRARRFGCKMCDYHAFRIYDIVNHLVFVHKMTENRDTLAKDFVARHELTYSKKDTDGDIILVSDENVLIKESEEILLTKIKCEKIEETVAMEEEQPKLFKTYERRKGQETVEMEVNGSPIDNKTKLTKVAPSDVKLTRSALKRNGSSDVVGDDSISLKPADPKTIDKRPMRKRIKPINNDFVYDMSSVLKKDMQAPETGTGTRLTRRRLTVVAAAVERALPSSTLKNSNTVQPNTPPLLPLVNHENRESIRTATQRILRRVVSEARGALSTMPDLPTERPQMRPRLTSTYQDEIQSGPIIDANDLEAARRKATLLDDAFLDKFTSRTSSSNTGQSTFKIKPCLELQHDTLNTLLEKMDSNKNAALQILNKSSVESYTSANANTNLINCSPPPSQLLNTAETHTNATILHCGAEELTEAALATSNHLTDLQTPNGKRCSVHGTNAMTTPRTPPPTPRKRFTLLQHLAENKQRKVDSLLRSALQN